MHFSVALSNFRELRIQNRVQYKCYKCRSSYLGGQKILALPLANLYLTLNDETSNYNTSVIIYYHVTLV